MAILTTEQYGVVQQLVHDAAATIGVRNETELTEYLVEEGLKALRWEFVHDLDSFRQKLVDDFQQRLHDEFVDTSWPRCPRHPNHPLWLEDGQWWCTRDNVVIAHLGELPSQASSGGDSNEPLQAQ